MFKNKLRHLARFLLIACKGGHMAWPHIETVTMEWQERVGWRERIATAVAETLRWRHFRFYGVAATLSILSGLGIPSATAQGVNVTTYHYDNFRTG